VTFAFTISGTFSNLLWGSIGDKHGFRSVFLGSLLLWIVSTLLLMFVSGLAITVIIFAGIGAAVQGFQIASNNLTLEFGDRDNLPMRIAIANTGSEIAGTVGPIFGGLLATLYGYQSVFVTSIIFLLIGGIVVGKFVPEPRNSRI